MSQGDVVQDVHHPIALSNDDKRDGYVLLCCSRLLSDAVIGAKELEIRLDAPRRVPARVVALKKITGDVAILTLRTPPIEALEYVPGQYVGIFGPDELPRAFSIANAPRADRTIELHVGRVPGGLVTNHVHDALRVGDLVHMETPQGLTVVPEDGSGPLLAIVGGTGYAPIQAILEDWLERGTRRVIHVYWGSRVPSGFYALQAARDLVSRFPDSSFTPVVSSDVPDDEWGGRRGLVHAAALSDFPELGDLDVFVCGPPALVDAARRDFLAKGLNLSRFYADAFTSASSGRER